MSMPKGFKHTEETRAKMRESAKQRWIDKPRTAESNALIGERLKTFWEQQRAEQEAIDTVCPRCKPTTVQRFMNWIGGK